ncbi:set domain containing protein, partial [Nannochloropsis gaditana CCMP526]|uniref:set domain containing protein n=1 Tax=Nannochloropsis gaditana (strain CCMP526) TaxID=1093141 RepID=UPI00029F501F
EYESDVRGVHAKEALAGDQVVVEIPLRCLITVEMGKESDVGKAVLASNLPLDAPKHIFLMLFMLTDRRNPSSFFKEFKWARMCVCSRNFGLEVNRIRTAALVPYADMLNHQRPRETKWTFDNARQAFTITTLQPIAPGAQVYDSYGQKCNHRFLLNYGFAVENNREADNFCPNEVGLWQETARKGERERGTMG